MEEHSEFHADDLYTAVKAKQSSGVFPSANSDNELAVTLKNRGLIPELRPYQLDALKWMLSREQKRNTADTSEAVIGNSVLGGILADEMGLGKTVEVLALILSNPHPSSLDKHSSSASVIDENIPSIAKGKKGPKHRSFPEVFDTEANGHENSATEDLNPPRASDVMEKPAEEILNDLPKEAKKRSRSKSKKNSETSCQKCGKPQFASSSRSKKARTSIDKIIEEVVQTNTDLSEHCQCPRRISETRQRAQKLYSEALAPFQSSNYNTKSKPSLSNSSSGTTKIRCICGGGEISKETPIECNDCHTWQHLSCLNISTVRIPASEYFCPLCTCKRDPVMSGTTLIITPATISYQWISEIRRHVSTRCRILFYKGVKSHGYLHPSDLARFDIIITTYQVLRTELHFADVALNEPPRLRRASSFMTTPSPLVSVHWWRICLDEAQMVEGTSTQAAKMALRLTTQLRWCVTGTPIQKSVADLYGLFTFLQLEPYDQFKAFRKDFLMGDPEVRMEVLSTVLAQVFWRSNKKDVKNQIRIPEQTQIQHWLKFSPVESHFYKQQHASCTSDALTRFDSFGKLSLRLSDVDRETLSKLLNPLLRLRQACCHPQMVKGQFVSLNREALTMEQLLAALTKKAFVDCEDAHRLWVAAVNGTAAVHIIKEEWVEAVEMYRTVLRKNEELKGVVKTDTLQLLHTTYNLSEVLENSQAKIAPTLRDSKLKEEVDQLKDHYLSPFAVNIAKAEERLSPIVSKVAEFEEQMNGEMWWAALLTRVLQMGLDSRCVLEVQEKLAESYGQDKLERVHNQFNNTTGLMYLLSSRLDEVNENRQEVNNAIKDLKNRSLDVLATEASYCHLRPESSKPQKRCHLCIAHDQIEDYETLLFRMAGRKEVDENEGTNALMDELRKGTWADGDTERMLKCLLAFARRVDIPASIIEGGNVHLKLFDALKREFRLLRVYWRRISDQAAAVDELNMAKLRLRLRLPGEKKVNKTLAHVNKRVASELETGFKETYETIYIIEPHEIDTHLAKLKTDETLAVHEFNRKKGRLLYLQNLEKAGYGKKGSSNPEECPICKLILGNKWSVLQCGHSFCVDCIQYLITGGGVVKKVNCAVCRQITPASEVSYVDTCPREETEQDEIVIKGSSSTKVEAVLRRLLMIRKNEPEAKALVFSTWVDVLKVIGKACEENGIQYCDLIGSKFQENLSKFKESSDIPVLLIPLKSGANGLNLIEATHVLLVEPILNPGSELQAIGRVHRIGQTKPTQVHRFLVKDTIEEGLARLVQRHVTDSSEALSAKENPVTLCELRDLFLSQTCVSSETDTNVIEIP